MRAGPVPITAEIPELLPPEAVFDALRTLARGVAGFRGQGPCLVEVVWGGPGPVRLCGLAEPLAGSVAERPPSFALRAVPAGPVAMRERTTVAQGCAGFWVAGAGTGAGLVRPPAGPRRSAPAEPDPAAPITGKLAAQTLWLPTGDGRLWTACRVAVPASGDRGGGPDPSLPAFIDRLDRVVDGASVEHRPASATVREEWRTGGWRWLRPRRPFRMDAEEAARLALLGGVGLPPRASDAARHTVVFGASGSGKSSFLIAEARARLRAGRPLAVLDVHGDLCARIVADLSASEAERVVGIDPSHDGPVPGVDLLGAEPGGRDAERAHLLAALRRLGSEDGPTYWGFRLERIFDSLIAVVQEERGSLRDLYELLVDPGRRELARARRHAPVAAAFLEELPAILRRNAEFLWPAASRLSRLLLAPRLAALVVPSGPPLPLEALLDRGRAVLWRVPIGLFGPEGSYLATSLLMSRLYLRRVAGGPRTPEGSEGLTVVLDEAQAVGSRLLSELLSEGRKFGLTVLCATQYPRRLGEEARLAAGGAVGRHVVFRTPRAHARELAAWVGLEEEEAARRLPTLPVGVGFALAGGPGARRTVLELPTPPGPDAAAWSERVARAGDEFGSAPREDAPLGELEETVLLEHLVEAELGAPGTASSDPAGAAEGTPAARSALVDQLLAIGALEEEGGRTRITATGRCRLGFHGFTGATNESAEHRALLLDAFVIFARHGHRLELVRQGRFDVQLPDARLRWFARDPRAEPPGAVLARMERWSGRWAWRTFGGRDVHLEAEVSGADRPARLRHGLQKGLRQEAYVLFLVGDAARARKVRRTLAAAGVGRDRANVWTLGRERRARHARPEKGHEPARTSP